MKALRPCPRCKENSVYIRVYFKVGSEKQRVQLCINKGCGFVQKLPKLEEVSNVQGW